DGLPVSDADSADAQRIAGVHGTDAATRLGMPADADAEALGARVTEKVGHWRRLSHSPLADRSTVGVCQIVLRSLDEIASEVGAGRRLGTPSDIVLAGGPGDGFGHDAAEQGEQDQGR